MYEWNRLEEAEQYSALAMEREDMRPYAHILVRAAIQASYVQQAHGRADEAVVILEQIQSRMDSPDLPLFIKRLETQKAYLSLVQGHSVLAREWLQSYGLRYNDEIRLYRVQEYLCLARALGQCGHKAKAERLLERLFRLVTSEDRLRDTIKVLILQSITLDLNGERDAALLKLEHAITLAEPHGYIRSFIDEGERMKELLMHYSRLCESGFIKVSSKATLLYVRQLLQLLYVNGKGLSNPYPPIEPLTNRETVILHSLLEGLSNKEIAARFGITEATVKSHLFRLFGKLGVNRRSQAIAKVREWKLIK
ncbi:LuxR C-terminal-related transcriptional regulator [Paenibacillus koleovorans]|uniref:LuxR C-terminal-related transcriptional regulator n=1 Tax=Paenibacillus koleovorans TaxID=121608 RepID=UPI0013E3CC8F|nr:LuxR C-terminal-related transcriptional regulator [Paenibacillus koleovorans]